MCSLSWRALCFLHCKKNWLGGNRFFSSFSPLKWQGIGFFIHLIETQGSAAQRLERQRSDTGGHCKLMARQSGWKGCGPWMPRRNWFKSPVEGTEPSKFRLIFRRAMAVVSKSILADWKCRLWTIPKHLDKEPGAFPMSLRSGTPRMTVLRHALQNWFSRSRRGWHSLYKLVGINGHRGQAIEEPTNGWIFEGFRCFQYSNIDETLIKPSILWDSSSSSSLSGPKPYGLHSTNHGRCAAVMPPLKH